MGRANWVMICGLFFGRICSVVVDPLNTVGTISFFRREGKQAPGLLASSHNCQVPFCAAHLEDAHQRVGDDQTETYQCHAAQRHKISEPEPGERLRYFYREGGGE